MTLRIVVTFLLLFFLGSLIAIVGTTEITSIEKTQSKEFRVQHDHSNISYKCCSNDVAIIEITANYDRFAEPAEMNFTWNTNYRQLQFIDRNKKGTNPTHTTSYNMTSLPENDLTNQVLRI